MHIMVNGNQEFIDNGTIMQMVRAKGLKPETLVVEYNREVVPWDRWDTITLKEGDEVELLRFVGGG